MSIKLLMLFIVLNVANVIIQTVKSIATIKCGKWGASIINALAYGLYTYVIIYTVCDLPIHLKALIVAVANLIGVYVVKYFEEKGRKHKMWKVEIAIPKDKVDNVVYELGAIPHNYTKVGKYVMFNCYCAIPKETEIVVHLAKKYGGKYSAYESKLS